MFLGRDLPTFVLTKLNYFPNNVVYCSAYVFAKSNNCVKLLVTKIIELVPQIETATVTQPQIESVTVTQQLTLDTNAIISQPFSVNQSRPWTNRVSAYKWRPTYVQRQQCNWRTPVNRRPSTKQRPPNIQLPYGHSLALPFITKSTRRNQAFIYSGNEHCGILGQLQTVQVSIPWHF